MGVVEKPSIWDCITSSNPTINSLTDIYHQKYLKTRDDVILNKCYIQDTAFISNNKNNITKKSEKDHHKRKMDQYIKEADDRLV